jgi:hypothetical protein
LLAGFSSTMNVDAFFPIGARTLRGLLDLDRVPELPVVRVEEDGRLCR